MLEPDAGGRGDRAEEAAAARAGAADPDAFERPRRDFGFIFVDQLAREAQRWPASIA